MKKIIFLCMALLSLTSAWALPAKKGVVKELTLQDGTRLQATLKGDEHLHFWQDADGNAYKITDKGYAERITDMSAMVQKAQQRRAKVNAARLAKIKRHNAFGRPTTYTGKKKGLVILVQYQDVTFKAAHTRDYVETFVNTPNFTEKPFKGSVHDYFFEQSRGLFDLSFDVVGPITLPQKRAYYGANDGARAAEMVKPACEKVNEIMPDINFKDYDWDGDGEVDQVFLLYAGFGAHEVEGIDAVWPHEYNLESDNYYTHNTGRFLVDGVYVNTYACSSELQNKTAPQITGIGAICHEFTHCLGLPDAYDTSEGNSNYGMAEWCLMDQGSYNGNSYCPSGYTGYERWFCGWLKPVELKDDPVDVKQMKSLTQGGDAYIIYNPDFRDEYYILENRQPFGFDRALPNYGLLVTHIDYDYEIWYNNVVNVEARHQRFTVVPADNSSSVYDMDGDVFPANGVSELSNQTLPATTLFNPTADNRKMLDIAITEITQNDDSSIAFKYGKVEPTDSKPKGDYFFYESFNQHETKGGNDGMWAGSIASGSFTPDNEGWVNVGTDRSMYGAYQCAKFGSTRKKGDVYSPFFEMKGTATVSYKAAPWEDEINNLTVTVEDNAETVYATNVMELTPQKWNVGNFDVTFDGQARLRFTSLANRFFLDEVLVASNTNTGILEYERVNLQPTRIYNLNGEYVGNSLENLPHGVYIVNGKKVVK